MPFTEYEIRGRKLAEWGTGIQPVCFGYDDADRMTSLTTFRCSGAVISIDPSERTDKDVTIWSYHDASGMETAKTYADGSNVCKIYDAYNRVLTETDARGKVKAHTYEPARGLLLGTTYSDSTSPRTYTYNHLGQPTQVTDAAGVRTLNYNAYGEQESDSLVADSVTHLITETRDAKGRSTGYTYAKNGAVQQTVTTGYGSDGRIVSAGFVHGGEEKQFSYEYLAGTHLLEKLTMPNNMTLTQSYEIQRDLLSGMAYHRGTTLVASRLYSYDTLGRPTARNTSRQGTVKNDSFGYNNRSELTTATVNGNNYAYDYDNIGNRETATESDITTNYTANALNQYTNVSDFSPTYDADGNQTLVKTSTGIWAVVYDAENRPVNFTNAESSTVIECAYDHMGRRATKKVTVAGSITLHQRYLYRGYLQIACCDLTRSNHPALWFITWDPTQPIATRPLAIQKDATWYTYGWDLTKNICELYGSNGYIRTAYTYTPYGEVTESANGVYQPIQWSSEYNETELGLVYYNYRHYNPLNGRWIGRDSIYENVNGNLYGYVQNNLFHIDILGLLNLKDVALKLIEGTNIYWGNTCPNASIEFDKVTPVLMLGPFPLRIYGSVSIGISPCYPKGKECPICELEANITIEAYDQYGFIANSKNAREAIRRRNKKEKGDLIFVPENTRSMGSGESGFTVGIETRKRCSKKNYSAEVYVFLRGSMGAGIGVYGSTQIKFTGTDVNYDDLLSHFHADAGISWGIYGASLEVGFGGKVSISKELPL